MSNIIDKIQLSGVTYDIGGGGGVTIDPTLDSGSTNAVANSAITTALNAKSDKGNFNNFLLTSMNGNPGVMFKKDNGGSKNLWLSTINGTKVFEISTIQQATNFSLVETSAITTSISSSSTDAQVPSAKAVYDAIQEGGGGGSSYTAGDGIDITNNVISVTGKVDTTAIVTAITSSSTDGQVPSAKCVYDQVGGLKLVKLTQSEYDALDPNYDSNTLYIVING